MNFRHDLNGGCGSRSRLMQAASIKNPSPVVSEVSSCCIPKRSKPTARRMTPSERLKITLEMTRENTRFLLAGPPEIVARRFELLRRENDERNKNMLTAIARTRNSR